MTDKLYILRDNHSGKYFHESGWYTEMGPEYWIHNKKFATKHKKDDVLALFKKLRKSITELEIIMVEEEIHVS